VVSAAKNRRPQGRPSASRSRWWPRSWTRSPRARLSRRSCAPG